MTDKQIIIDCVDVSEWTDGEVYYKLEHYSPKATKQIAFDLYKQLKAKEQECETLASQLDFEVQKKECLEQECEEQLDQLKADLEQEKALKETYLACYKAKHEDIEGKLFKLSKTLTEIKEIAEHCIKQDICTICDYSDKCHIEDEEIPTYDVCKLILQKISECEGNDELTK